MRISDWSSDVCSSDLDIGSVIGVLDGVGELPRQYGDLIVDGIREATQVEFGVSDLQALEAVQHDRPETPGADRHRQSEGYHQQQRNLQGERTVERHRARRRLFCYQGRIRAGRRARQRARMGGGPRPDLRATGHGARSEEPTSELQSLMRISYA